MTLKTVFTACFNEWGSCGPWFGGGLNKKCFMRLLYSVWKENQTESKATSFSEKHEMILFSYIVSKITIHSFFFVYTNDKSLFLSPKMRF